MHTAAHIFHNIIIRRSRKRYFFFFGFTVGRTYIIIEFSDGYRVNIITSLHPVSRCILTPVEVLPRWVQEPPEKRNRPPVTGNFRPRPILIRNYVIFRRNDRIHVLFELNVSLVLFFFFSSFYKLGRDLKSNQPVTFRVKILAEIGKQPPSTNHSNR